MSSFDWIYAGFWNIFLGSTVFLVTDAVVKSSLRNATGEQEKKRIWLVESGVLFCFCGLIYLVHHGPWFLLLLTVVTYVKTQLLNHTTNLSNVLGYLRAHWENYLQHEDNMKQIEKQQQQQQQLQQQALGMAGLNQAAVSDLNLNNFQQTQHQGYNVNFPFFNKQQSNLHYPPNATVVSGQDRPTYSMSPNSASYRDAVQQSRVVYNHNASPPNQNWNKNQSSEQPLQYMTAVSRGQYDLAAMGRSQHDSGVSSMQGSDYSEKRPILPCANLDRRPLRPDAGSKILPRPVTAPSTSIRSKFMNVIGFGPTVPKPVGLINNNQNMCFINSVIQCLSRGPYLAQCLTADAAKELECTVDESELLSSLAQLLDILNVDPSRSDYKKFEASRFRAAASVLNPGLVKGVGERMEQQDSAEFLMWLLDRIHSILNKNSHALQCDPSILSSDERFSSPRLARLKLIYGDLNINRIKELKDQCRREIAVANGLENESYAEPIQRLSDLEWLTHKQSNDTVVDGLFTGQMVEAYHSLEAGHISVNLQTFNVLPVSIAAPQAGSSLVMLEDCFTTFCNIEVLGEQPQVKPDNTPPNQSPIVQISGLRQRNRKGYTNSETPVSHRSQRLLQQQDAGHLPSPIAQTAFSVSPVMSSQAGESGFSDSSCTFKTSTPINAGVVPSIVHPKISPRLQRRCLLRQLPECLIIQLMRFQYNQATNQSTKLRTPVSIRLKNFDLREFIYDTVTHRNDLTIQNGGHVFELYGVCVHIGPVLHTGHYVSYCLDGDKWYRMDDQTVTEINIDYQLTTEEIRQNAYLLFYRKMTGVISQSERS